MIRPKDSPFLMHSAKTCPAMMPDRFFDMPVKLAPQDVTIRTGVLPPKGDINPNGFWGKDHSPVFSKLLGTCRHFSAGMAFVVESLFLKKVDDRISDIRHCLCHRDTDSVQCGNLLCCGAFAPEMMARRGPSVFLEVPCGQQ